MPLERKDNQKRMEKNRAADKKENKREERDAIINGVVAKLSEKLSDSGASCDGGAFSDGGASSDGGACCDCGRRASGTNDARSDGATGCDGAGGAGGDGAGCDGAGGDGAGGDGAGGDGCVCISVFPWSYTYEFNHVLSF